ncbi:MAG: hypothetical protein WAM62_03865 [Pseudolabrys sp.]
MAKKARKKSASKSFKKKPAAKKPGGKPAKKTPPPETFAEKVAGAFKTFFDSFKG